MVAAALLLGCASNYSRDPKVAGAYAGAAAGIAVAQAIASHAAEGASGSSISGPTMDLFAARDYTLRAINRLRAEHVLPPLSPSAPLSDFAQIGSEWLGEDHQPHRHVKADARCARCGENQGNADGEPAAPVEVQIDGALREMMRDDGERRANLLSPTWRFVGVGIVNAGGAMALTIDFSEMEL